MSTFNYDIQIHMLQYVFEGTRSVGFLGDIALDTISVMPGKCEMEGIELY